MARVPSILPILLAMAVAAPVKAEPAALDGTALTALVSGATISIDTPLGTAVPVHYTSTGQVSGEAGSVAFALGSATDRGRWWVEQNRLCHRWTVWFDRENQCMRLRRDGNRLFWSRDDGKTGTATITAAGQPPPSNAVPQYQSAAASLQLSSPPLPAPMHALPTTADGQPPAQAATLANPGSPALRSNPPPSRPPQAAAVPPKPSAAKLAPSGGVSAKPAAKPNGRAVEAPLQPIAPPPAAPTPTYKVANVEEDDVLNVRIGPSADHDAVGAIQPGAEGVKLLGGCRAEWCPVVHRNVSGWVNSYYLAPETPRPVTARDALLPPSSQKAASTRR